MAYRTRIISNMVTGFGSVTESDISKHAILALVDCFCLVSNLKPPILTLQ